MFDCTAYCCTRCTTDDDAAVRQTALLHAKWQLQDSRTLGASCKGSRPQSILSARCRRLLFEVVVKEGQGTIVPPQGTIKWDSCDKDRLHQALWQLTIGTWCSGQSFGGPWRRTSLSTVAWKRVA